jgi:two-component system chemotaxis response regulator CheB
MIRALVVDDSAYNRVTITRMLEADSRIQVVATAVNGEDAIKQLVRHEPDVVILDLEMPVMDGFSFLRWVMANRPVAVVVVSSKTSDRSVFKALELGAVDFIAKPGGRVSPRLEEIQRDLMEKVLHIAEVRLENVQKRAAEEHPLARGAVAEPCETSIELVAIGCSTGGPPAIQHLFETLPLLPVSIVIAQHMPPTFTRLFADRINRLTDYDVREGANEERLTAGGVYIAPGGMQMTVHRDADGLFTRVAPAAESDLYSPSVDRLLVSASGAAGAGLVGVILTGMGDDGARGIRTVRQNGGKTIAESAETAIIFGLPHEAIQTGCVDLTLPLTEIAQAIKDLCSGVLPSHPER